MSTHERLQLLPKGGYTFAPELVSDAANSRRQVHVVESAFVDITLDIQSSKHVYRPTASHL